MMVNEKPPSPRARATNKRADTPAGSKAASSGGMPKLNKLPKRIEFYLPMIAKPAAKVRPFAGSLAPCDWVRDIAPQLLQR